MWVVTTDNRTVNIQDTYELQVHEDFEMQSDEQGGGGYSETAYLRGVRVQALRLGGVVQLAYVEAGPGLVAKVEEHIKSLRDALESGAGVCRLIPTTGAQKPIYRPRTRVVGDSQ